jgi:chromosome segregation ATPase
MSDESQTKPTIETVLERLQDFRASVEQRFTSVEQRLGVIEQQLENMDIRFDRLGGLANKTHSELMYLRADFKEFKSRFNEPA